MRKRGLACFLLLLVCLTACLPGTLAAEGSTARVVFESSEPDADGCFQVTMTMYDVTFRVYQFALRYDPAVVTPVGPDGAAAGSFGAFARKNPETDWINTVGTQLNAETGLIDFSGYIMPGTQGELLDQLGQATVGSDGLLIYTFYFKKVAEGDAAIQVATQEKGEPYRPACPQGVIVAGEEGEVPVTVTFQMAESVGPGGSEDFTGQPQEPVKDADELLNEGIFLKIGGHAAVADGGVVAIYPGEPNVTAYAHDNRTFVPIRFVSEELGAQVEWENDTQTAVITKDGRTVRMQVGALTYTLDGEEKAMDVPAEFTPSVGGNFRTMVPVRFVTEALGYQVEWDQTRNLVVIMDPSYGWDPAGETEGQVMNEAVRLMTMYGGFV